VGDGRSGTSSSQPAAAAFRPEFHPLVVKGDVVAADLWRRGSRPQAPGLLAGAVKCIVSSNGTNFFPCIRQKQMGYIILTTFSTLPPFSRPISQTPTSSRTLSIHWFGGRVPPFGCTPPPSRPSRRCSPPRPPNSATGGRAPPPPALRSECLSVFKTGAGQHQTSLLATLLKSLLLRCLTYAHLPKQKKTRVPNGANLEIRGTSLSRPPGSHTP